MLASRPMAHFALRVALGAMFIAHAYLKLAVFTVPGFAGFLGSVGLPASWPGRSSWPSSWAASPSWSASTADLSHWR